MSQEILFLDLETTGTDPVKDRIVQVGMIRSMHDFRILEELSQLVNPGMPIPAEAQAIHKITDAKVAGEPRFSEVAGKVHDLLRGRVVAGFGVSWFDVGFLWEELNRSGIQWDTTDLRVIDAGVIFKKKEPRTLSAAMKFYLGVEHDKAHDALADSRASLEVLETQCHCYEELRFMGLDQLVAFSRYDDNNRIDFAGKLILEQGYAVYNIGKAKGVRVCDDPGFGRWMLTKDFSEQTKVCVRRELAKHNLL